MVQRGQRARVFYIRLDTSVYFPGALVGRSELFQPASVLYPHLKSAVRRGRPNTVFDGTCIGMMLLLLVVEASDKMIHGRTGAFSRLLIRAPALLCWTATVYVWLSL